jgi:hypothetical protein
MKWMQLKEQIDFLLKRQEGLSMNQNGCPMYRSLKASCMNMVQDATFLIMGGAEQKTKTKPLFC